VKRNTSIAGLVIGLAVIVSFAVSPAPAQQDFEKQFMEKHQKEMAAFMNKCSACHSLQRVFAKKRTKEEWGKILEQMAGKPHAMISQDERKNIQNWIDLMESALQVGP
jgi:hypothetical protein